LPWDVKVLRAGRRRPDRAAVYQSRQAFSATDVDLNEYPTGVVRRGVLLRGDHPLVAAHADMFVAAGDVADRGGA
jgi:hypothetical protein